MKLFLWKVNVKCFGFNNFHQDFKIMKNVDYAVMDGC